MKRVFSHIKRLFRKFGFFLILALAISPIVGLCVLIVATVMSMALFSDPVDVDAILHNFTEEELEILSAKTVEEKVSDDDYLNLLVRYQNFFSPKKVDKVTTWTESVVTKEAYINVYEMQIGLDDLDQAKQKEVILEYISKNDVLVKRLLRSNRNVVYRYNFRNTGETCDIIINPNELEGKIRYDVNKLKLYDYDFI